MQEIVSDVLTWSSYSEEKGYNLNGYLLKIPEGNICIDPAPVDDDLLEEIADAGVDKILLTDRNHCGAALRVRARTGARTAIHADDAPHVIDQGTNIDENLDVGGRIGPLEVVPVSGSSPGEVALYWKENRILFVGDTVMGDSSGERMLLREENTEDPQRLRSNIRKLVDLDFDILLVGEGAAIVNGAREKLRALVEGFPD